MFHKMFTEKQNRHGISSNFNKNVRTFGFKQNSAKFCKNLSTMQQSIFLTLN